MSAEPFYTGGCLCGGFKYEIKGKIDKLMTCHCDSCHKTCGATFWSVFLVPRTNVTFLERSTATLYARPGKTCYRFFCNRCGCSLYNENGGDPKHFYVAAGTLDGDPGIGVTAEIFVNDKKPWHTLYEGVPNSGEGEVWKTLLSKDN